MKNNEGCLSPALSPSLVGINSAERNGIYRFLLLTTLLTIALYSCSDIIEPNISKQTINVLTPVDGYKSANTGLVFWWEALKGAEKYNLQIVKPSFISIQNLILDTNITDNKYSFSLLPGTYQWRIRAMNNGSNTDYVTRTLTIDSTLDLTYQTVVLSSPADNFITNVLPNSFKWNLLYNATLYQFQLVNKSDNTILKDTTTARNSVLLNLAEGAYIWKVRAQNVTSSSSYALRNITVDITPPDVSTLTSPANDSSSTNPVSLTWTSDLSAIADSLFIYQDSLKSQAIQKLYQTTTSYNFTGTIAQTYFWRLKSVDAAGNWSAYSPVRKFKIK